MLNDAALKISALAAAALCLAGCCCPADGGGSEVAAQSKADDVDLADIEDAFHCGNKGEQSKVERSACKALGRFKKAKAVRGEVKETEELWFGRSFRAGRRESRRSPAPFIKKEHDAGAEFAMIERHEASSEVESRYGADQLIGVREMWPDNPAEKKDILALLKAIRKGEPAPRGSKSAEFMRGLHDEDNFLRPAVETSGASLSLNPNTVERASCDWSCDPDNKIWVRQYKDRLIVVSTSSARSRVVEAWRVR